MNKYKVGDRFIDGEGWLLVIKHEAWLSFPDGDYVVEVHAPGEGLVEHSLRAEAALDSYARVVTPTDVAVGAAAPQAPTCSCSPVDLWNIGCKCGYQKPWKGCAM